VEIWTALPELYLLIILTAFFEPSIWVLGFVLSIFSWIGLSDVMRAEMLRLRETDYVAAARGLGLSHWQILVRHLIPNSLAPLVTFFPFRVAAAIFALSSLDFLGLGLSGQGASLGALIAQGKDNLDAWWIGLPAVALLTAIMVLLVLIGEGLKEALRSS
jgi:microcin C transport system permease protein